MNQTRHYKMTKKVFLSKIYLLEIIEKRKKHNVNTKYCSQIIFEANKNCSIKSIIVTMSDQILSKV